MQNIHTESFFLDAKSYWCRWSKVMAILFFTVSPPAYALSLQEAEALTLNNDFLAQSQLTRQRALNESAVADGQLNDPQMTLGLFNAPLDKFDLDSEPNTQFRLGVNQSFPRGDTLEFRAQQTQWSGQERYYQAQDQLAQSLRSTREHFLDVYYAVGAQIIIDQSHQYFSQLVDIAESFYRVGRVNQQDVLRAQLELSRLHERVIIQQKNEHIARAALSRWLDMRAYEELQQDFPQLAQISPEQSIIDHLILHPMVRASDSTIAYFQQGVAIAKEQYKPGWTLGIEYRKRFGDEFNGTERDDQMAALVKVDLPLFTDKRQDRRLSSSQYQVSAVKDVRADQLHVLRQAVLREYSTYSKLAEQSHLYTTRLLPDAQANSNASLKAYQSGVVEFTTLARARITQLDIQLEALRIKTEQAKAQARILYLMTKEQA